MNDHRIHFILCLYNMGLKLNLKVKVNVCICTFTKSLPREINVNYCTVKYEFEKIN